MPSIVTDDYELIQSEGHLTSWRPTALPSPCKPANNTGNHSPRGIWIDLLTLSSLHAQPGRLFTILCRIVGYADSTQRHSRNFQLRHRPDMSDSSHDDWLHLVRKTRRRPLIWFPVARPTAGGTAVIQKPFERLFKIAMSVGMGVGFSWAALAAGDGLSWGTVLVLSVGVLALCGGIRVIFFDSRVFIPEAGDRFTVQIGFCLLPRRLELDRTKVTVDFRRGSDTTLHSSLHGFKYVILRHLETDEVVHLGYTLKGEDALRTFDAMSKLLAPGGSNASVGVITLEDGSLLQVDRLATWEAGHWRKYKSTLSIEGNVAQIERKAFGKDRNVVDRKADVFPVQVKMDNDTVRIHYADQSEKSFAWDDCVAIQVCREEIAERYTRYEVNLIEDFFRANRVNLMSFDLAPNSEPAVPLEAARRLGQLLECEIVDHC